MQRTSIRGALLGACLLILVAAGTAEGAIIHVSATGTGDGSQGNPAGLQQALDTARTNGEDDTIRLMTGPYTTPGGPYTYSSTGNDGMSLRLEGGWLFDWSVRRPDSDPTTLSADNANQILVIHADAISFSVTIDGVWFTKGNGGGEHGGAVSAVQANGGALDLVVNNCLFADSAAPGKYGGGLYVACSLTVTNCMFNRCSASSGGSIMATFTPADDNTLQVSITDCEFDESTNVGGWQGNAIFTNVETTVTRCHFNGKHDFSSSGSGSHIYVQASAKLYVRNSTFYRIKTEHWGAGIEFWNSGGEVSNCLFLGCKAGEDSGYGAIDIFDVNGTAGSIEITNCTFAENRSQSDLAGAIHTRNHDTIVKNCIFWDNGSRPVYNGTGSRSPTVSHSIVEGGLATTNWVDGGSNLLSETESPFAGAGTYYMAPNGPGVDVGDNAATGVGTTDRDGKGRIYNMIVDMGCYEVCPKIGCTPGAYAFAVTEAGAESTPQVFTVRNTGSHSLSPASIDLSGPDAGEFSVRSDNVSGNPISTKGSATFDVVFAPTGSGAKEATLTIPSDDPLTPNLEVQLTGTGQVTVTPIAPTQGTIGTVITLSAEGGFGDKKPNVWLEYQVAAKTKKKPLKVLEYSDTTIQIYMKAKLTEGTYDLKVQPKVKGAEEIDQGDFTVVDPDAESCGGGGEVKDEITATGDWFGDKKARPKVYFEYQDPKKGKTKRKKCKVVKDSLAFDEQSGESALKFLVPKVKVTTGNIVFVNKVGEVVLKEGFTIGK